MAHTTHYRVLPPETTNKNELIKYACYEKPCRENAVFVHGDKLDRHARLIHSADNISIDGPYN